MFAESQIRRPENRTIISAAKRAILQMFRQRFVECRKGGRKVPEEVLSLLGEVCPVPLLRTKEALDGLLAGRELVVETDLARATRNITQWCLRNGYPYEIEPPTQGVWRVRIWNQRSE